MRKLASVQSIKALEPIEGADAIEKATVLGWQLVVKKNEFKVGNLAVYCEIDCIMPDRPEFELPMVPLISTDYVLENDIQTIVKMATVKSKICPDAWAEGIVIRPVKEIIEHILGNDYFKNDRVSFKAINPEFLLKYGE